MEQQEKVTELVEKLQRYNAGLVGMGHEKKYNRKTVIVSWNNKWHHFYGTTYERCLSKALKKIQKKRSE